MLNGALDKKLIEQSLSLKLLNINETEYVYTQTLNGAKFASHALLEPGQTFNPMMQNFHPNAKLQKYLKKWAPEQYICT